MLSPLFLKRADRLTIQWGIIDFPARDGRSWLGAAEASGSESANNSQITGVFAPEITYWPQSHEFARISSGLDGCQPSNPLLGTNHRPPRYCDINVV